MSAVAEALRKTPSTSGSRSISELWRGEVAEVFSDGSAQVIVPHLAGPDPLGRIESLVPNLAVGARVIVGAIEGRRDDLVVLSALGADGTVVSPGRFTDVSIDNAPTLPEHAVRKDYADALGAVPADPGTIVRRGASGSVIVQNAYLNGLQTAGNAATSKTYVDNGLAGKAASVHTHAYGSLTGIPATFAPSAHTHPASDVTGVLVPAQLPAATSAAQGALSGADKAKLDAATSAATAGALMARDAGGASSAAALAISNAPSIAAHATRKDYVDAQVATRAASAHTHTYADISGTVPTSALPPLAVNDVFTVPDQASMLALVAQRGDMAIRSDTGRSYALSTDNPGTLADWKELMATGQVVSVAGRTGVIVLAKADVGLGNVDNTSDAAKPISTATQTALNGKSATTHSHNDLDAATAAATAATLAKRDGAGRAQFADPAAAQDAATKNYVDKKQTLVGYFNDNTLSTGLSNLVYLINELTVNVIAGHRYKMTAALNWYGTSNGDVALNFALRQGGAANSNAGTIFREGTIWSAPMANAGKRDNTVGTFVATATGTLRFSTTLERQVTSSPYNVGNREIIVEDMGIDP